MPDKLPLSSLTRRDFDAMAKTHDSSLPAWGPYSKIMAGVAHVRDKQRGASFNVSVFPVIYRGNSPMPTETIQSNYHPWYAAGDLSFYTYRFELEWKDQVYCDVSYIRMDEDAVLVEIDACNNTDLPQMIGVHHLASMQFPKNKAGFIPWVKPECDSPATYVDGVEYASLRLATLEPQDHLVYDGRYLCEVICGGTVRGRALGGRFGKSVGDRVEYKIDCPPGEHMKLMLRAKGHGTFALGGCASGEIGFDTDNFALYTVPIGAAGGELTLSLCCTEAGDGVMIDHLAAADTPVRFVPDAPYYIPVIDSQPHALTLTYREDCAYGIVWEGEDSFLRQIFSSDWEPLMRRYAKNNIITQVRGDGREHFTDLYTRPFFLDPHTSRKLYAVVLRDPTPEKYAAWQSADKAARVQAARAKLPPQPCDAYTLSQQLMRATVLTNLVFPVYVQGEYIRHFTPGKWWDSLYTWDSGFIALGLCSLDPERALDTLNCYLTEVGNPHAAFIHHGTPLPVQAYVYKALFDRSQNRDFLASFYPRLRQYYEFLMGRVPGSDTRRMKSGLLNTFSYFYNSGGWDDYPPQMTVHEKKIAATTCPAVSSTHAIVFARILRQASVILSLGDEAVYDRDIAELAEALQKYSWDGEAGYFSYVTHDADGRVSGILRDGSGVNHNMGLDGAEAILCGICTPEQETILADAIMDPAAMWTDCGISTVDRRAPYYREDGYWNGSVWMPHQWFAFLGMLTLCRTDDAAKIARTALDVWKRETDACYRCFEHFVVECGRGAGWHAFSGLSSPVVQWYHALRVAGTVTAPPCDFVMEQHFSPEWDRATLTVDAAASLRGESALLVAMAPGEYRVRVNGEEQACPQYDLAIAVRVPDGRVSRIEIERMELIWGSNREE